MITHKIKATTATISADSQYHCQILIQPSIHSWIPHAPYPYTYSTHIYGNRHQMRSPCQTTTLPCLYNHNSTNWECPTNRYVFLSTFSNPNTWTQWVAGHVEAGQKPVIPCLTLWMLQSRTCLNDGLFFSNRRKAWSSMRMSARLHNVLPEASNKRLVMLDKWCCLLRPHRHAHAHARTHTHTHTCTRAHTHTHTQFNSFGKFLCNPRQATPSVRGGKGSGLICVCDSVCLCVCLNLI